MPLPSLPPVEIPLRSQARQIWPWDSMPSGPTSPREQRLRRSIRRPRLSLFLRTPQAPSRASALIPPFPIRPPSLSLLRQQAPVAAAWFWEAQAASSRFRLRASRPGLRRSVPPSPSIVSSATAAMATASMSGTEPQWARWSSAPPTLIPERPRSNRASPSTTMPRHSALTAPSP